MKQTLFFMVGIPGSGKSTFLRKNVKNLNNIVSRDTIRFSLLKEGESYFSHEDEVFKIFIKNIKDILSNGESVYVDATHISAASRNKLLRSVDWSGNTAAVYMEVPLEQCLERNEQREGVNYVPPTQIKNMFYSLSKPDLYNEDIDELYIVKDNKIEHIVKEA